MIEDGAAWKHVIAVTRPALLLASPIFLDEIAERLDEAGIQAAVARHDSAPIFDWMVGLLALQGDQRRGRLQLRRRAWRNHVR